MKLEEQHNLAAKVLVGRPEQPIKKLRVGVSCPYMQLDVTLSLKGSDGKPFLTTNTAPLLTHLAFMERIFSHVNQTKLSLAIAMAVGVPTVVCCFIRTQLLISLSSLVSLYVPTVRLSADTRTYLESIFLGSLRLVRLF